MKVKSLTIGFIILAVVSAILGMVVIDSNESSKVKAQENQEQIEFTIEKNIALSPGFYFIKSKGSSARLVKEGKELRILLPVKRVVSGETITGFELPGLWYGEYKVNVDRSDMQITLQVGNPYKGKTLESCNTQYPGNANLQDDCLGEVIPFMVREIGGKETRDLLINNYSDLIGRQTGCGVWLGAYAEAVYDLHGFEKSLSMDYMTCRYSYMHYIIAIDSIKEGNFQQLTNFCRDFKLEGVDLLESRDQCILGFAFAGIFSMNYSIESMVAQCDRVDEGYSYFTRMLCYEGVFGAYRIKSGLHNTKKLEVDSGEIIESWRYLTKFPTHKFCNTISKSASLACYRYTLTNQIDEEFYNKDIKYKIKWLRSINQYCKVTGDNGCWYGLADASFKALSDKPFNSFTSVSEGLWETLVDICEDNGELSAECINRVTLDQINKTFSEEIISKWCGFLLKTANYTCNYQEIEQYKKRINPVNKYDPAARRASGT